MNSVSVDAFSEVSADRTGFSLLRVGSAHQFTVLEDGTFAFQHLNHNGTRGHESNQVLEEGTFFVNGVEAFGFGLRELTHLSGNNLQTSVFKTRVDLTDHVLSNCIRFDDRKGALDSHWYIPQIVNKS